MLDAFHIWIGSLHVQVPNEDQFDAFQEGATYRVYWLKNPPVNWILSAERVDDVDP